MQGTGAVRRNRRSDLADRGTTNTPPRGPGERPGAQLAKSWGPPRTAVAPSLSLPRLAGRGCAAVLPTRVTATPGSVVTVLSRVTRRAAGAAGRAAPAHEGLPPCTSSVVPVASRCCRFRTADERSLQPSVLVVASSPCAAGSRSTSPKPGSGRVSRSVSAPTTSATQGITASRSPPCRRQGGRDVADSWPRRGHTRRHLMRMRYGHGPRRRGAPAGVAAAVHAPAKGTPAVPSGKEDRIPSRTTCWVLCGDRASAVSAARLAPAGA